MAVHNDAVTDGPGDTAFVEDPATEEVAAANCIHRGPEEVDCCHTVDAGNELEPAGPVASRVTDVSDYLRIPGKGETHCRVRNGAVPAVR